MFKPSFNHRWKIILFFQFIFLILKAQPSIQDIVKITNPEVGSFIKNIEFPIDTYTGGQRINIPVYTIKDGSLEIPITLEYNSSGIQVAEEASWVGLGWSLNVGGVITQVAAGEFDSSISYSIVTDDFWPVDTTEEWNYKVSDYVSAPGVRQEDIDCIYDDNCRQQFEYSSNGKLQPDVYYFSFMGYSGKFFIDPRDKSLHQLQKENNLLFKKLPVDIGVGWEVITEDGAQLVFEKRVTTSSIIGDILSESFYLTAIYLPSGDFAVFDYEEQGIYSSPVMNSSLLGPDGMKLSSAIGLSNSSVNTVSAPYEQTSLSINSINTKNLKLDFVTSSREDIAYKEEIGKPALKLDAIEVSVRNSPSRKRTFLFKTSYFEAVAPYGEFGSYQENFNLTSLTKRLRLDAFYEEGLEKSKYEFFYSGVQLPIKTSYAMDYWGYYNGQKSNRTLIPRYYDLHIKSKYYNKAIFDYGANRAYDFAHCIAGMLTDMKLPTGGRVEYAYEPHVFGGDFIPTIQEIAEMPPRSIKTVSAYLIDGNFNQCPKSGFSNDIISHCFYVSEPTRVSLEAKFTLGNLSIQALAYNSLVRLGNYDEHTVFRINTTYPDILDFSKDVTVHPLVLGTPREYCLSVYMSNNLGCWSATGNANVSANITIEQENDAFNNIVNRGYSYGAGLRVSKVTVSDDDQVIAKQKVYTYGNPTNGRLLRPLSFTNESNVYYSGENNQGTCAQGYILQTGTLREVIYSGNNLFSSPYYSTKGNVGYELVIESSINLDNIAANGLIKYHYKSNDISVYHHAGGIPLIPKVGNGLLEKLEIYDANGVGKKVVEYDYDINHLHTGWGAYCENLYNRTPYLCVNELGFIPAIHCGFSGADDPMLKLKSYYFRYYPLPCYEVQLREKREYLDGIEAIERYTYNPLGQRIAVYHKNSNGDIREEFMTPVGSYEGNDDVINQMKQDHWLSPIVERSVKVNNIREFTETNGYTIRWNGIDDAYVMTSKTYAPNFDVPPYQFAYRYNNAKVVQARESNGEPVSYYYQYKNTLPVIKAENCLFDALNSAIRPSLPDGYSSMEELLSLISGIGYCKEIGEKQLWQEFNFNLRSNAALENARLYTYTYDPLFGMTSETDPNGLTTYYEYDGFGRLQYVKDHEGYILQKHDYHYKDSSEN